MPILLWASLPSHASGDSYLHELVAEAHAKSLATTREWQALVHYRANLIFPGVTGQADDDHFYLAADGKTNPAAELDATLRVFFDPPVVETDSTQHAQCRFIARYHWLQQTLHFDPTRLPPQPCERFHAWRGTLNASALTLVFPSAYINNPSSMFGHTLLRVDAADQDERTRLLGYAVNYAVGPGGDNGAVFIIKSLVGAYPGTFSLAPYYIKVREYSDMENRDIWEYRLNFTQAEIDMLLMHAWELGPVKFDYYFFDENCAYHLLSLFEVARPSLTLTRGFRGWVIPVDTVRRVVEESGMVAEVVYRPSNNTRLRDRLARLDDRELAAAQRLAAGDAPDAVLHALPAERRAVLLEAAYALVRHEAADNHRPREESARLSRELLLGRSRIDVKTAAIDPPPPAVRPDQGHKTRRMTVGIGRENGRNFQTIEFRPAYNDLLDPSGGYTEGAQINFMDLALRRYEESGRVTVERLSLVDIYSLAPRDRFFKPVSWKINTGLARTRLASGSRVGVYRTNGGAGLAFGNWDSAVVYAFAEATLDVGDELKRRYTLGLGPSVGVFLHPREAWKLNLFARVQDVRSGDDYTAYDLALEQSLSLGRQQALRLAVGTQRERGREWGSGTLSWQWYF